MESVPTAAGTASPSTRGALKDAIVVDTEQVRGHLDEVVRGTVEQTLNQLPDEEADRVAGAGKYERNPERMDTRAGSYRRRLQTKAGEVELKAPRLRKLPLETAIIERYKRRENSVEEALIEMYLAGWHQDSDRATKIGPAILVSIHRLPLPLGHRRRPHAQHRQ